MERVFKRKIYQKLLPIRIKTSLCAPVVLLNGFFQLQCALSIHLAKFLMSKHML